MVLWTTPATSQSGKMPGTFSGFHFTIDAKRGVSLGEMLVGSRANSFGVLDELLVLETKSVSPQLSGRIRTKEPVADLGSHKLSVDLSFDAPVMILGK
jgi:hypothetical protein